MFESTGELEAIERHLRMALKRFEEEARVRGDFLETVFCVHSALEDAFDVHLRGKEKYSDRDVLDQLQFSDKAQEVVPEVCDLFDIKHLNQQRNSYAHPGQVFYEQVTDKAIKDTAIEFIRLALESWTRLFGSPPPSVSEPPLPAPEDVMNSPAVVELKRRLVDVLDERDTLAEELDKRDAQIQELQKRPPDPPVQSPQGPVKRKISWRALVLGLILLLPMPFIAGLGEYIWRVRPAAWYGLLILAALLLVLSFFALRSLWRFMRSVGVVRTGAILSMALVVATLAFIPFAGLDLDWIGRPGAALTRVLGLVDSSIGRYVSTSFATGSRLPGRFFSATPAGPAGSPATTNPTRVATVTATADPRRTATATRAQTPMPAGVIAIGAHVIVKTDGTALLSRSAPGKDKDVVVRFENSSELVVIDGPAVTDGLTWWKVEGKGSSGWSVAGFLVPVAPSK